MRLVVLYTAWCHQCRYIKPDVLRLAQDEASSAAVSLVLADTPEGQALRDRYAIRCLPAFIALDREERALLPVRCGYVGYPQLKAMVREAAGMAGCSDDT